MVGGWHRGQQRRICVDTSQEMHFRWTTTLPAVLGLDGITRLRAGFSVGTQMLFHLWCCLCSDAEPTLLWETSGPDFVQQNRYDKMHVFRGSCTVRNFPAIRPLVIRRAWQGVLRVNEWPGSPCHLYLHLKGAFLCTVLVRYRFTADRWAPILRFIGEKLFVNGILLTAPVAHLLQKTAVEFSQPRQLTSGDLKLVASVAKTVP